MRFLPEHRVLEFVTSGDITLPDVAAMVAQGVAESQHLGTKRVLVDHRKAVVRLGTMQIYETPAIERAAGVDPGDRVAFVMAAGGDSQDDYRFYENRSYNSGNDRRIFTDRDEALAWLAAPPDA